MNYADALRRVLAMPGDDGPRDLAPEMVAVLDLCTPPEEWQRYLGWNTYVAQLGQTAGATFNTRLRWRAPGAGILYHLIDAWISSSTAGQLQAYIGNTSSDLANAQSYRARDSRIPGDQGDTWNTVRGSGVVVSSSNGDTGSMGSLIWEHTVLASTPTPIPLGLYCCNQRGVNPANPTLEFRHVTVNTNLFVTLRWRERKMTDYENQNGA